MKINIKLLSIWLIVGLVVSIIWSITSKENIIEFIFRLGFTELLEIIVFLVLSKFKILDLK